MLAHVAFVACLVTIGILLVGVIVSLVEAGPRLWPHGGPDWSYRLHVACWAVHVPAFVALAWLDAGSLFATGIVEVGLGLVLLAAGLVVAAVAMAQLGLATSTGMVTDLYTGGCYRYSRNPQTVGIVAALAGAVLVSGSLLLAIVSVLDAVCLALAVIAEEPWLEEQYGEAYAEYRRETPRFVAVPG